MDVSLFFSFFLFLVGVVIKRNGFGHMDGINVSKGELISDNENNYIVIIVWFNAIPLALLCLPCILWHHLWKEGILIQKNK